MVRGIHLIVAAVAGFGAILVVLGALVLAADVGSSTVGLRVTGVSLFLGVTALCLSLLVALSIRPRQRAREARQRARIH